MVVFNVFSEGDKARQRGNERSHAADVYTEQKLPPIVGKLRQQNGGRYVANALAGKGGEHQGTLVHKITEQLLNGRNSRHIPCEDEECHKGEKQAVIYLQKRLSIQEKEYGRDDDKSAPIGKKGYAEYNQNRKQE